MARIADEVPGFAGFYLSDGQTVIQLMDVGRLSQARAMLETVFLESFIGSAEARNQIASLFARADARQVDHSFRELYDYYQLVRPAALSLPGVTMGDIDERRNRIVIGVESDAAAAIVSDTLAALGVPDELVIVEHFEGITPVASSASLQSTYRPVVAGLMLESALECTLGYNARRKVNDQYDGYWYFLTNSHCTSAFGSPTGPDAGQATTSSIIGSEVADPPTFTSAERQRSDWR